jgi:PAS domain S-box-containing protein
MTRFGFSGFGALAGLTLLLLATFMGSRNAVFDRGEAVRWETHTHEVLLAGQNTLSALQDAETSQRGYLITGDTGFFEHYTAGRQEVGASIDRLAEMTRDNAAQQVRIDVLRRVAAARLGGLADAIALARSGDLPRAIVGIERGGVMMGQVRLILGSIAAEERRLLGLRHAEAGSAAERDRLYSFLLAGIGVVAMMAALTATIVASRSAARLRLSAARDASERLLRMFVDRAPVPIAMFDTNMCYLATNRRYLEDCGLGNAGGADVLLGRSHYEVFQSVAATWRDIHCRVLAGETCSAEDDAFIQADGRTDRVRWEMVPWHRANGSIGGAVLFSEVVTARKQAEARQAVLLELAGRLRGPPRETVAAAVRLLGEHFGASRVGFSDVDTAERQIAVAEEYADGVVGPTVGSQRLAAFGSQLIKRLRAGHTVVVSDILSDPRTRDEKQAYFAIGARSLIAVPLGSGGQLRATLYVSQDDPRAFTADEVQLVEEVAARIWLAVEHVRISEALERSDEEFRTLADGIPSLCWMAEPDGHIYWYNRRWYEYSGTVAAEMAGLGWQSVHDPKVLPAMLERWHNSLATGEPFEMTFPLRGSDGVFRPFMTRMAPVFGPDGKIRRWLGVSTDVTEAVEREAALQLAAIALRESEARLQVIFDTVPVGLIIGETPSGRLVASSHQADVIFGHPMMYTSGAERYHRDWVCFHADGRRVENHEYPMARALAGEAHAEMEVMYPCGDGKLRWVRLIGAPLLTGGRITGAVVAALDIDRKARRLEELSGAHADLEHRVTEAVQAREAAQTRLSQAEKLTALGQLAGGIAHDFNNVMQAVAAATSLIGRHAGDPVRVKRLAASVEEVTQRGASVTSRLLAFAHREELRAEPVDVPTLLDGLHEVLAHTLGAGIAVRLDVAPGLLPVLADRSQLETALVNLATNARDAMPLGGTITLSASLRTVLQAEHPIGLTPGAYVRFAVADTGTGMDTAMLAKVMEPFFTTKGPGRGTGLGLPMARGFAEQLGVALSIDSAPGQGTTVMVWLPVTLAASASPAAPDVFTPRAGAHMSRILLVDDEALIRDVIAEELTDRGYDVIQAARGDAALAVLDADERVDLIICDLSMPGMDGVSLIHAAHARRPRLPAILLTGYAGDAATLAVGGALSGSFSLLRKPVSGAKLADRVATLLEAIALPVGALPSGQGAHCGAVFE